MIDCPKCNKENDDERKFCRECGTPIKVYCKNCSFLNSYTDKFCGGCGSSLIKQEISPGSEALSAAGAVGSAGRYTTDELRELVDDLPADNRRVFKKKEMKDSDEVSQDFLDNIFSSPKNEKDEEED